MVDRETRADSDGDLRRAFEELREGEQVPSFAEVLARTPGPRSSWRRPAAVAALVLLLAAGFFAVRSARRGRHPEPPRGAVATDLGKWNAPTDFLLEVPGRELFDSVPAVPGPLPPQPRIEAPTTPKGVGT